MTISESACVALIFVAMIAAIVTAPAWVDVVDSMECGVPKVAKRVQL